MEEKHVTLELCERTSEETGTEVPLHCGAFFGWHNGRINVQVPGGHGGGFVVGCCVENVDRRGVDGLA